MFQPRPLAGQTVCVQCCYFVSVIPPCRYIFQVRAFIMLPGQLINVTETLDVEMCIW